MSCISITHSRIPQLVVLRLLLHGKNISPAPIPLNPRVDMSRLSVCLSMLLATTIIRQDILYLKLTQSTYAKNAEIPHVSFIPRVCPAFYPKN